MKKQYKILLIIWAVEIFIILIMREFNLRIQSLSGSIIGTLVFLLPIQILIFLLGNDEKFSERKRICFRIVFWFINTCYLFAVIGALFWRV